MLKLRLSPQFQNRFYLAIIIAITITYLFCLSTNAQSVVRHGRAFIESVDSSKAAKKPQKTGYVYIDKNNVQYPIYLSSSGKAFIIKKAKSGNTYRKYLPEVTKQLQQCHDQ